MPPRHLTRAIAFHPPRHWRTAYKRIDDFRTAQPYSDADNPIFQWRRPHPDPELWRFYCLVGLMLSAMVREQSLCAAMTKLTQKGLTPSTVKAMGEAELRGLISNVTFYNRKARHIVQVSEILLKDYDGKVPRSYDQVIALPGVGPKMAHLLFQIVDNRILGIAVDTHVHRISQRLGWVPNTVKTPEQTRKALEAWLPQDLWADVNLNLVTLGQNVCTARRPKCDKCVVKDLCPSSTATQGK